MWTDAPPTPFGDEPLEETQLSQAPLHRVIAQLRFPAVASVASVEYIAPFQEALRAQYPILRREQEMGIVVTPAGISQTPDSGIVWRLTDHLGQWRVALAPTFLALDTSAYTSRRDFLSRLAELLRALETHINPATTDRFGLRYLNRIHGDSFGELNDLVRQEALGLAAVKTKQVTMHQALTIGQFAWPDATQLQVRTGILPANTTVDPSIEPVPEPSWILDLDVFDATPARLDTRQLLQLGELFGARAYRFFRWVVTPELVRRSK